MVDRALIGVAVLAVFGSAGVTAGQQSLAPVARNGSQAAQSKPAAAAAPTALSTTTTSSDAKTTPPEANWATQCSARTRQAAVECSVQQSIIKSDTRQLIATFGIRIPPDTHAPVMMIQLPLGLYLPAGLQLQVDQEKAMSLPVQTCDANGCFAGAPVTSQFLDQLRKGKTLRLGFENLAQSKVEFPVTLDGFASAYDAIK